MNKVAVVFWSGTGNTKEMAYSIAEGVKREGVEVTVFTASEFTEDKMDEYEKVAFGCPAMGAEELEESEFLPMFEACENKLNGKSIVLFGSYGWGDGEWMSEWEERCSEKGAILVHESILANDAPDVKAKEICFSVGKQLAL